MVWRYRLGRLGLSLGRLFRAAGGGGIVSDREDGTVELSHWGEVTGLLKKPATGKSRLLWFGSTAQVAVTASSDSQASINRQEWIPDDAKEAGLTTQEGGNPKFIWDWTLYRSQIEFGSATQ